MDEFEEAEFDFRLNQDVFDMEKIKELEQKNIQLARGYIESELSEK